MQNSNFKHSAKHDGLPAGQTYINTYIYTLLILNTYLKNEKTKALISCAKSYIYLEE